MLKLLVFDLDGTLADTREDLALSVNHALREVGRPPLPIETVIGFVGDGARNLILRSLTAAKAAGFVDGRNADERNADGRTGTGWPEAIPDAEVDAALDVFLHHYQTHCLVETEAYPGVKTSLDKLFGYAKAVLTNKPVAPARTILDGLELAGHFRHVLGGDNPHGRKPDPAGLEHLMSAEAADPGETVLIGDGVQDLMAARNAGAHFLGFLGGIGSQADLLAANPEATFKDMRFLPEALAAMEAKLITAGGRI